MHDKLLNEYERIGIKAMKTGNLDELKQFVEELGEKNE